MAQGEGLFHLVGKKGIATTILRPSGKVEIDGENIDAVAAYGIIEKGMTVEVLRFENSQIVVRAI
jgi:membrane-bound serine protease (ClpP class)